MSLHKNREASLILKSIRMFANLSGDSERLGKTLLGKTLKVRESIVVQAGSL